MNAKHLLRLIEEVERLKLTSREGWKLRGVREAESVAEHALGVAFLSMLLADEEKLDVEKVIRMALLHDLQEARVGDISIFSPRYPEKREIEERAIDEALKHFPGYRKLWGEYVKGKSPEAKSVKQADKLELLIQALEYERKGYDVGDFWDEEYEFNGLARELYELLKKARP
ncbi:MAG: HD domain-containing protein [Candidatus Hydrothermarchaeales archaeon]